jgi:D-glycero-D-manno-heptose 1,7-bisphosphate phosphatase
MLELDSGGDGKALRAAVLLDRDGVIIENRANYVRSWADVSIYPQALEALARLHQAGCPVGLVTNQSVVGRGLLSLAEAQQINSQLVAAIECAGGRVEGVYMCPHAPDEGCGCRKPQPGLIQQAAAELGLDLSHSVLIGDALSDLEAGRRAGVGRTALVRTGRGAAEEQRAQGPVQAYDTLAAAVEALLAGVMV